jgi:hypothetical protein
MTFRGQSRWLWSVLAGLAVTGCAGRGDFGSGQNGGSSGSTAGSGSAGSGSGSAGSGSGSGSGGAGNGSGAAGNGGGASTGSAGTSGGGPALLPASIRRLTNAEYDASVQALLGTTQTPSQGFPPDARQAGRYTGNYTINDAQRVDSVLAKALDDAAQALVTEARGNGKLAALAPCANASTTGAACATTFIGSFGAKAYRRALTSDEVSSLMTLYTAGATGGTYNDGIDLVTRGLLQSAGFLYITELGDGPSTAPVSLTGSELASTLAYLVTGAPPDQTLLDMGTAGGLATPDAREAQVRRLLATAGGKTRMVSFVREWLGIDGIADTGKDATVYPKFASARASMDTESLSYINEVLQSSTGTLGELLGANWSIVDSTLAGIYGVTSAGTSKHTMLPNRLGILNQGAFLSVYAHAGESGPVLRGVAVMRRVACLNMPDPTTLNIVVVPPAPDLTKSTRDRYDVHATDAVCASCHATIDSIGFAFEQFDGMGAPRPLTGGQLTDKDNGNPGVPTSAATTVVDSTNFPLDFPGSYADSNALATALAASPMVAECLARQMFFSSSGRSSDAVVSSEQTFVDVWNQLPAASQGKFAEVLVAYVRSPLFEQRSQQQ